jgi:hypothetical protein
MEQGTLLLVLLPAQGKPVPLTLPKQKTPILPRPLAHLLPLQGSPEARLRAKQVMHSSQTSGGRIEKQGERILIY